MSVDVRGDIAVGAAHQRMHGFHVLVVLSENSRKRVPEHVPTDVRCDFGLQCAGRL